MNEPPDPTSTPLPSKREPLAYVNGRYLPFSQATLPLYDAGLVQGACVTEFIRTFRLKPYLLREHLERFQASCRLAEIALRLDMPELKAIAEELVVHNGQLLDPGEELALIALGTPGAVEFYAGDTQMSNEPTLVLHTAPLRLGRFAPYFESGVHLMTPGVRAIPNSCVDPHIKHRSRLHWRLAQQEVSRRQPGSIALLLDQEGFVTETAAANLCIVEGNSVLSPPLDSVLNGISLNVVRGLCDELGLAFSERRFTLAECERAQEAFLTNTSFCLAGVRQINESRLLWPGPVSKRILSVWSEKVGVDISGQILGRM